jgi:hypothetical protein
MTHDYAVTFLGQDNGKTSETLNFKLPDKVSHKKLARFVCEEWYELSEPLDGTQFVVRVDEANRTTKLRMTWKGGRWWALWIGDSK